MIKLKKSKVKFIEEEHKYFLGKKELVGITGTLIKKAFPDTYKSIPEKVLMKAAERGGMIHQTFELFCTIFDADLRKYVGDLTEELVAFNDMLHAHGLKHLDSEYLVTDNKYFASAIDAVFTNDKGEIILVDYKTTSQLYYDHVSLQLSIYAKWFEMMNPNLKVTQLVCMWFKDGKSKYQQLPRVSDEKIDELIAAYLNNDGTYKYEVEIPDDLFPLEQEYSLVTSRIEALSIRQNELKEKIMDLMVTKNMKTCKTAIASYTYVPPSTTQRFDSKAYKESVTEEEYNRYIKVSETKPQIRIKIN